MTERKKEKTAPDFPHIYFLGGPHPVNESFIKSPPPGYYYTSNIPMKTFGDFTTPKEFSKGWKSRKKYADSFFNTIKMPRMIPIMGRHDLVHTNCGMIPISTSPWIASIENPSAFFGFREAWHEKRFQRKMLANILTGKRCKSIMPYSEASKRNMLQCLYDRKNELDRKMTVIYPAIDEYLTSPDSISQRRERDRPITKFLFVGDHFFDKGGREVVKAFKNARGSADCELTLVTSAPPHQAKEFEDYIPQITNERGITFHRTGIARSMLLGLYRDADVFALPSYMDQVPFVIIEAMASGLPIIGSNSYAIPEMSQEGKNGFNVKSDIIAFPDDRPRTEQHLAEYRRNVMIEEKFDDVVEQMTDIMVRLSKDPETRLKMGSESLMNAREGRFSTKRRNESLAGIYAECLNEA